MNNITIRVYPIENAGTIKANVSVNIDDMIVINDFKIIEGKNGLFVSMPQRSYTENGTTKYRDIAYFLDRDTREDFEDAVFKEYDAYMKKGKRSNGRKK